MSAVPSPPAGETGHVPDVPAAARLFAQLSNLSRLAILHALIDGPRTVRALTQAVQLSQPLVSQHLRRLRDAQLVIGDRRGREVHYRLADARLIPLIEGALEQVSSPPVPVEDAAAQPEL